MTITRKELMEVLSYDATTGQFKRLIKGRKQSVGTPHSEGYIAIAIGTKKFFAHRLAWIYVFGELPKNGIDHIDGNKKNNSIWNLREATPSQNQQNKRDAHPNNRTGFIGVHKHVCGKFGARIGHNGKQIHIGLFDNAEEAHAAYLKAKRELHEFCTI